MAGSNLMEGKNTLAGRLEGLGPAFRIARSSPWAIAVFYLLALVLAEALLAIPSAGMTLHALILLALLLHSALTYRRLQHRFLLCLALVPLTRVLSLALPLANFPFVYWYALVGTPLIVATILTARVAGLKRVMFGMSFSWRSLPFQLLIGSTGLLLGYIQYLILRPEPLVEALRWELVLLPALILLIFTGFLEEAIFRGAIQYTATQNLGRLGLLYVTVLFTALHLGYRSLLEVFFVFGVGLLFGLITLRRGSLLGVSLSHGLINISMYLIFPFLLAQPAAQPVTTQDAPSGFVAPVEANRSNVPKGLPPDFRLPLIIQPEATEITETATSTASPTLTPTLLPPTETPSPTASEVPAEPTAEQPTEAPSPEACGPPAGWVVYTVRPGDTLGRLSQRLGVSVGQLQQANCMGNSTLINAGQSLYVPFIPAAPTALPPPTQTLLPTPTEVLPPTPTEVPATPTEAPPPATDTPVPPTDTAVPEPTEPKETPTLAPTEPG